MAVSSDFERVKGDSARRYRNKKTGEIISRRQWLQLKAGTTLENKAKMNRLTNQKLSELRPARGRASALKKSEVEKELIAEARIEDRARRMELAEQAKRERQLKLIKDRKAKKHVRAKKFNVRLLKPGRLGVRIPFNEYDEYVEIFKDAKASGKVLAYSLGLAGYDERDGKDLGITVFTLRAFDRPIKEDAFNDAMADELEERSYFMFTNFFMYLAFKKEYALQKTQRAKAREQRKRNLF